MAVINILSPHVADMIAAGEVVERPASVIKELMENSFDAGAKSVTVEIKGGGAPFIRVTDDGCGMAPEDAGVAFLRHATSKLHDEHGLEAIGTMGFRGEALAAISAVSEVELTTRRRGDDEGTFVTLTAGDIQDMGPAGCPEGTVMAVKGLFYNTPARLKFLKSDRSEASACVQTALRCALGRPEISVRFIRDGKEEFFSPGDGRAESAVYSLLGRDIAKDMLPCSCEDGELRVHGFISSPAACRGNRSAQYFYCNGRYIRSSLLQAAVEQAYKNSLLTGRYPACVMYLELSCAGVDVNVHPAKTEVKFSQERRVFEVVYHAALAALTGEDRIKAPAALPAEKKSPSPAAIPAPVRAAFTPPQPQTAAPAPKPDFYRSMTSEQFRAQGYTVKDTPKPAPKLVETAPAASLSAYEIPYQTRLDMPNGRRATEIRPETTEIPKETARSMVKAVEKPVQNVESQPTPDHKIVGEALKTYIIVEVGAELVLIDKHAAHERMNFDRLKKNGARNMSQTLLESVTLHLTDEDCRVLEENGELLSEFGFEIEPFGERDYAIRAVPAGIAASDAAAAVEEICEKLHGGKAPDPDSARDEILHTVACKAAIKAGWDTDVKELETLVDAVLSGQIKYCPHGRPISVTVTRRDLDKLFKRIV